MSHESHSTISAPTFSFWSAAREATGVLELPRLGLELRDLRREPRGDGSPVLVLPGFGADDRSTWPIRRFLTSLEHDARGWGRGSNVGDVPDSVERVGEMVTTLAAETGRSVSLVGWSLGGYIARDHPGAVRRVVTLGSPVIGGPKYTTVASVAKLRGWDVDEIELQVEQRKKVPLEVPVTAIFSRRDGVVAWRACVDPEGDGTHIGLGFSPRVYRVVARRLALPPSQHAPNSSR